MSDPRWLVTGGGGLIGGRLLEALDDAGVPARALAHRRPVRAAEVIHGDLRDAGALPALCQGIDVVAHCAAALDPVDSEAEAQRINCDATLALARAAKDAGCRAFVFLSSQAALGWRPDAGLVGEDAPATPTTAYGRSKRAAEEGLLAEPWGSTRVVILRPPTVYGPGERRNFLALCRAIARGGFPILGRGDNRMSFCHLDNLIAAIRFVAEAEPARGILHVADEPPATLAGAARILADAAGARLMPGRVPLSVARGLAGALEAAFTPLGRRPPLDRARLTTLTSDCALDTSRLRALGFRPPVRFEDGAREAVRRYRSEGAL